MFRLDRFLTLHVFRHLMRIYPQPKGIRIPILMYHSISDDPETGHPYFWINTSPRLFAEHMKFLRDNDYKVISLSEAVEIISQTSKDPTPNTQHTTPRYMVLTFDDGYRDFYTNAFPILKKFGFSSTLFLPTDFINGKKPGLKGKEHLSWKEVQELQSQGILFGSHTASHPQLHMLMQDEIEREIRISKETIEDRIGYRVDSFSYPYQFPEQDKSFIQNLKNILLNTGYQNGVSTRIGTAGSLNDTYFLKRLPINSDDTIPFFKAKLEGGFDWLHNLQFLFKQLKRISV